MNEPITVFSKSSSSLSVKMVRTCLLIYFFNCTDLLFTYTFLKTGMFSEANPIMQLILHSTSSIILFKILVPAWLMLIIFNFQNTSPHFLLQAFLNFVLLFYFVINCSHIYYLYLLVQNTY